MQNVTIKSLSFFVGLALLALLCLAGCNDKPTEPPPVKDYSAYFVDALYNEGNWYFAYHPTTNQLDSFWLPYVSVPVISADGELMYISNQVDHVIDVLELDSFTVIDQLPYKRAIAVSPDNQLVAVEGEGLHILQTSDYSEVLHDSVTVWRGSFSRNSQRFYGATSDGEVYILDISEAPYSSVIKSFDAFWVVEVIPSIDETKWFLYLFGGLNYFSFQVYDTIADSTTFRQDFSPGHGELELTPNGKFVFYTNSGNEYSSPGPPWITVYDVNKNEILTSITTARILEEPYENGVPLKFICVTPDGRWLVVLPAISYPFVFAIDVYQMKIAKNLRLGHSWLMGLGCQNSP